MTLTANENALLRNAPKSVPDLVKFLTEYLQWPLPSAMEPEDVTPITWSFDELHLDVREVAKIRRVSQLPKFTESQSFGVFCLELEDGSLPVGALRRVVNQMVKKRRLQPQINHQQWDLGDLLFFCQAQGKESDMHIVHFHEQDGKPILRTISWSSDSTSNRIELVAERNLAKLKWRSSATRGEQGNTFESLSEAFSASYREGIKSAARLAKVMADVAKDVRNEVLSLHAVETADGPIRELFDEIRIRLNSNLTVPQFADMYAQTMVYGLLTARITHPEDFIPGQVTSLLKFENPFLDSLYARFRVKGEVEVDLDEFGLRDLSQVLSETDVDEILADFGSGEFRDDPVVFFYEEFLQEYDPKQKKELGTYYTPVPVVKFMVNAVNEILRDSCGVRLGIADREGAGEYFERLGLSIPQGLDLAQPVVSVLDPATGTGTYILHWLRSAFEILKNNRLDSSAARAGIVSSLDAFEISLSSYSVAELKVNLELDESTRSIAKPRIRLTDTLEGRRLANLIGDDALAVEGRAALEAKFNTRHSIVIGNPPYLRTPALGNGGWVTEPIHGDPDLFSAVTAPDGQQIPFSYHRSIHNLYVYFWRFGMWKAFEQNESGPAILTYITASSWLRGPGFTGLRKLARELADDIYIVDLDGTGLGYADKTDENIFPIQTPVSIVLLVRKKSPRPNIAAEVKYFRLLGTKEDKLNFLEKTKISEISFEASQGDWMDPFPPSTDSESWLTYPTLTDLLPWQQPGALWSRTWPIAPAKSLIEKRWAKLVSATTDEERGELFSQAKTGRNIHTAVSGLKPIAKLSEAEKHLPIVPYAYRPFDYQYAPADPRLAKTESPSLWASMSPDQVFLITSPKRPVVKGPGAIITVAVPDFHFFSSGGKDVLPRYRDSKLTPNVDPKILDFISDKMGQSSAHTGKISFEELFDYIYGVMAGTKYTARFAHELQTPGPRIPITLDRELFSQMSQLGKDLIALHSLGHRSTASKGIPDTDLGSIFWSMQPSQIPLSSMDFSYDPKTQCLIVSDGKIEGVKSEVWNTEIGNAQVIRKWLGYRTRQGAGLSAKSSNPLDQIRPTSWSDEWSRELLLIVRALDESIQLVELGEDIMDRIIEGDMLDARELPDVQPQWRKIPPSSNWWQAPETLF